MGDIYVIINKNEILGVTQDPDIARAFLLSLHLTRLEAYREAHIEVHPLMADRSRYNVNYFYTPLENYILWKIELKADGELNSHPAIIDYLEKYAEPKILLDGTLFIGGWITINCCADTQEKAVEIARQIKEEHDQEVKKKYGR